MICLCIPYVYVSAWGVIPNHGSYTDLFLQLQIQ